MAADTLTHLAALAQDVRIAMRLLRRRRERPKIVLAEVRNGLDEAGVSGYPTVLLFESAQPDGALILPGNIKEITYFADSKVNNPSIIRSSHFCWQFRRHRFWTTPHITQPSQLRRRSRWERWLAWRSGARDLTTPCDFL